MTLETLLKTVEPLRQTIRISGNPEARAVETLLDISARHVAAARLGVHLYTDPTIVGDFVDAASVETGALMLVFGCGRTSVDLSASALLRWKGHRPGPGREHDFEVLKSLVKNGGIFLGSHQELWFRAVDLSVLTDFRHAIIHRLVRQGVNVVIGRGTERVISPGTADPLHEENYGPESGPEAADLLNDVASFVEEQWKEFWSAL